MTHFVILHTENPELDPLQNMHPVDLEVNHTLFPKIACEAAIRVLRREFVYYLAHSSKTSDDQNIYDGFHPIMDKLHFFPGEIPPKQFLSCKKQVMENGSSETVEIVGIGRTICLRIIELLFRGKDCTLDNVSHFKLSISDYRQHSEEMGWDLSQFQEVYRAELNAVVLEELTDRPLPKIARFL